MEFIKHNTIKPKYDSLFQLLNQYRPLNKYSADGRRASQKGNRPVSDFANVPSHSEYIFNKPISGLDKENMLNNVIWQELPDLIRVERSAQF